MKRWFGSKEYQKHVSCFVSEIGLEANQRVGCTLKESNKVLITLGGSLECMLEDPWSIFHLFGRILARK